MWFLQCGWRGFSVWKAKRSNAINTAVRFAFEETGIWRSMPIVLFQFGVGQKEEAWMH